MTKNLSIVEKMLSPMLASVALGVFVASPAIAEGAIQETTATSPPDVIAQSLSPQTIEQLPELTDAATPDEVMEQVTSVSQLADVKPTDWAFQALQSLVERYGCIAGYPDGTYRGNRALTRYEFAAGLNACLDRVNELIGAATGEVVKREDLETLKRLQEEFAAELATLRGRVDVLESRTATLERQQFSTTTKLFGQVIFGLQGRSSPDINLFGIPFQDDADQVNVISNAQLSLYTQFNERSSLLTGLQAGQGSSYGALELTNDVRLAYAGDTNSSLQLSDLTYRQLLSNNFAVIVGPVGVNMVNVFRGANRIESAGQGPLSQFAQRNPIININGDGAGIGFDWQVAPAISLQGVYSANSAQDPTNGGLFGGNNGATTIGAQLAIAPTDTIDIALNYVNAYSPSGFLGTRIGDDQLALTNPLSGRAPLKTNAVGATVAWRVSPKLTLGGWAGFTHSDLKGFSGSVETFNWMAFLNFPDLFVRGNLGAIYVGQPPRITDSTLPDGRNVPDFITRGNLAATSGEQPGTTTHVEAFYRFALSDNISLTPGLILIFNPRQNSNNDTITIGVLRTTFTF